MIIILKSPESAICHVRDINNKYDCIGIFSCMGLIRLIIIDLVLQRHEHLFCYICKTIPTVFDPDDHRATALQLIKRTVMSKTQNFY